jgi:hypothetical protein
MRPPYSTLTPTHIYDYAASLLEPYLQWHDYGPKCTVKTLLQVLFYAAGHLCSVFAACSQLRTAPSDQAVRDALTALCPDPAPLEQRLNRLFAAQIPKGLRKRTQRVALDLILVPLPWSTPPARRRDLPQSGQRRHDPLSCLCHCLYRALGPAFYRGPDPCRVRHRPGRGAQAVVTPAPSGRDPPAFALA